MFKFERERKMPIIFDDDSQMFFNTGFIKKNLFSMHYINYRIVMRMA